MNYQPDRKMPRRKAKDIFMNVYETAYEQADTSRLQAKYLSATWLFNRAWKQLRTMRRLQLSKGLDFGCGAGASVVLGKLLGMKVVGMDIPYFVFPHTSAGENPFGSLQRHLQSQGYDIVIRETMLYPWKEFKKRSFDCVISFNSIDSDY
jgi:hypothetical protein